MFKWLVSQEEVPGIDFQVDNQKIYRYRAETYNHFKINEMHMNRCMNTFVFEVLVVDKTEEGYVFDWTLKEKEMYKGMEYLGENIIVLEKLASIKDHLSLLVNGEGQIIKVLNKEELQTKWNILKENLYENPEDWPIEEAYKNKFLADGDHEHSSSFPIEDVLNQDPVFSTFFFQNTKNKTKSQEDALIRMEQPSNLLMTESTEKIKIPLIQNTSWQTNIDDNEYIDFLISRNADKARLNKKQMNKLLRNFPFAEQEIQVYIYDYEAVYKINGQNYMISEAKYNLLEKVNHDLEVNHTCTIRAIN